MCDQSPRWEAAGGAGAPSDRSSCRPHAQPARRQQTRLCPEEAGAVSWQSVAGERLWRRHGDDASAGSSSREAANAHCAATASKLDHRTTDAECAAGRKAAVASSGREAFPVLKKKLHRNQAQPKQDPKRCICSARIVLQPTKHNPQKKEAFPVVQLYCNQAQPSQDPKRGISSNTVVLQPSTTQPRTPTEAFLVLGLYTTTNQSQSSQDPRRGISTTTVVQQPSTIRPGP